MASSLYGRSISLHADQVKTGLPLGYSHGYGVTFEVGAFSDLRLAFDLATWKNVEKLPSVSVAIHRLSYGLKGIYSLPLNGYGLIPFCTASLGLEELEQEIVGITKTAKTSDFYFQGSVGVEYGAFESWIPYFEMAQDWGLYQSTHMSLGLRYLL